MKTKSLRRYTFLLTCVLIFGDAVHLFGANMRSFIESVRRKAPVVYVGSVKEVRLLQRTKFDIKAKAIVDIKVGDANSGEQLLSRRLSSIQVTMRKRQCWRVVLNINCDLAFP